VAAGSNQQPLDYELSLAHPKGKENQSLSPTKHNKTNPDPQTIRKRNQGSRERILVTLL
jgi:hypothetical protein